MTDRAAAEIHAAGAVLWRRCSDGLQIALVHRPRYDDWSLPKGKREGREHALLTAVREVREETGLRVVLGRRLVSTHYLVDGRPKRVDYWAARMADPAASPGGFVPNDEVDELAWLDPAAARERLSYRHDTDVLDGFLAGPPDTTPVILLRHAAALGKSAWRHAGHHDDLARPLSDRGTEQAKLLAEILGCFPHARPVSSAAERCAATLRPYADMTGAQVEPEPALTLQPGLSSAGPDWLPTPAARDKIAELTAVGAPPVVLCAHRQNLPTLLEWACRNLQAPLLVGRPLRKAGMWILQASAAGLVSAERHELSE
jgi:8-oxo-dGTP diphosphatase